MIIEGIHVANTAHDEHDIADVAHDECDKSKRQCCWRDAVSNTGGT